MKKSFKFLLILIVIIIIVLSSTKVSKNNENQEKNVSGDDAVTFLSGEMIDEKINDLTDADYLPNKFDAIIKSIDSNLMTIEPLELTAERNVSTEIFITLEEEVVNGRTFVEGQPITITYTGEITEINERHQLENVIAIE